jgi:circadian clock protein KaiB
MYKFRLYIIEGMAKTQKTIKKLKIFLKDNFDDNYILRIINVIDNPKQAEADKVFATPTLIKKAPPPEVKIIGDLDASEKIQNLLGI